jgi:hypothetical protein
MKKLLLILIIVIFSTNSSIAAPAYECNLKENKCLQTRVVNDIEIKYEYIGQIKNGRPDGKGKLNISDTKFGKTFAEGTFKTNKNNFIEIIDGKFNDDLTELYIKNGQKYKIVFKKDGYGQKKGTIFEGTFKNFILIKGKAIFPNGEKFTGEYFDNGLIKEGTYEYIDGTKFTGTFDKGIPKKGLMSDVSGGTFSGTFGMNTAGKFYRIEGIYKFSDGSKYEGSFFSDNDSKYKNGTYEHKDGRRKFFIEGKEQYFSAEKRINNQKRVASVTFDWEYILISIAVGALPIFYIYKIYKKIKYKKDFHKFAKYFIFITIVVAGIGFLTGSASKAVEAWFSLFMIGVTIYWIEIKNPVILGFSIREISRLLYTVIILVVGWQIFCRIFQLC